MTPTRTKPSVSYWIATAFILGQFVLMLIAMGRDHWTEALFWLVLFIWMIESRDREEAKPS